MWNTIKLKLQSFSSIFLSKKVFISTVIALTVLKLVVLPFTDHPFDFSSFVYQIRQYFDYGLTPLTYWNKGVEVVMLWTPSYALYSVLTDWFGIARDNLVLLHLAYKLPLLLIDFVACSFFFLLLKSVFQSSVKAKLGFLLMFSSSLFFYTSSLHGHYEILTALSVVLVLYGLKLEKKWFTVIGLVLGISTKYFLIILVPIILLYLIANRTKRLDIVKIAIYTAIGTLLSFLPFLLSPSLLKQLTDSLFWHSAPVAPVLADRINLFPLSILSYPLALLLGHIPNNVQDATVFQLTSKVFYLFPILFALQLVYIVIRFLKTKKYEFNYLVLDSVVTLTIFSLLLQKFQLHYLIWFLPFYIIGALRSHKYALIYLFFSLIAWTLCLKSELGTFTFFIQLTGGQVVPGFRLSDKVVDLYQPSFFLVLASIFLMFAELKRFKPSAQAKLVYISIVGIALNLCCILFFAGTALLTVISNPKVVTNSAFLMGITNIAPAYTYLERYEINDRRVVEYYRLANEGHDIVRLAPEKKKYFVVELIFSDDIPLASYKYFLNGSEATKIDKANKKVFFDSSSLKIGTNELVIDSGTQEKLAAMKNSYKRLLVAVVKDTQGNLISQSFEPLPEHKAIAYIAIISGLAAYCLGGFIFIRYFRKELKNV